jgi:hypothetical protein
MQDPARPLPVYGDRRLQPLPCGLLGTTAISPCNAEVSRPGVIRDAARPTSPSRSYRPSNLRNVGREMPKRRHTAPASPRVRYARTQLRRRASARLLSSINKDHPSLMRLLWLWGCGQRDSPSNPQTARSGEMMSMNRTSEVKGVARRRWHGDRVCALPVSVEEKTATRHGTPYWHRI